MPWQKRKLKVFLVGFVLYLVLLAPSLERSFSLEDSKKDQNNQLTSQEKDIKRLIELNREANQDNLDCENDLKSLMRLNREIESDLIDIKSLLKKKEAETVFAWVSTGVVGTFLISFVTMFFYDKYAVAPR